MMRHQHLSSSVSCSFCEAWNEQLESERRQDCAPEDADDIQSSSEMLDDPPDLGPSEPLERLPPGSTRLVRLYPGQWSDALRCSLHVVEIDDLPEYEAVSYTWGTSGETTTISLEGHGVVEVNISCVDTLRRLRTPSITRTLWIDALCIDQRDMTERNHQVDQMDHIYRSAARAVIYVGETADESAALLSTIRSEGRLNVFIGPNLLTQAAVANFLRRRWFSRVWVLQEVLLSRDALLICGEEECPWRTFYAVVTKWVHERSIGLVLPPLLGLGIEWPADTDLITLLQATRACGASNPLDKVFALRGLLRQSRKLEVDYSMTKKELYAAVALQDIRERKTLDVLSYVTGYSIGMTSSWIPDWNRLPVSRPVTRLPWSKLEYNAGGSSQNFSIKKNDIATSARALRIMGTLLGTVTEKASETYSVRPHMRSHWHEWTHYLRMETCAHEKNDINIAYGAVFLENSSRATGVTTKPDDHTLATQQRNSWFEDLLNLGFTHRDHGIQMCEGRNMFRMSTGKAGLCPREARVDDIVCVVLGVRAPLVLRRRLVVPGYMLVGECYVPGFMDGEVLAELPGNRGGSHSAMSHSAKPAQPERRVRSMDLY